MATYEEILTNINKGAVFHVKVANVEISAEQSEITVEFLDGDLAGKYITLSAFDLKE